MLNRYDRLVKIFKRYKFIKSGVRKYQQRLMRIIIVFLEVFFI